MSWLENALVGIDLSRVSDRFVEWLPELRRVGVERLYLLYVIPVEVVEHVAGGYPVDRLQKDLADAARGILGRYAERLRGEGFEVTVLEPPLGNPGMVIAEKAREVGAGLIVVASRGHGFLRLILLGSTVEETINSSDRPVLVARVGKEGERPSVSAPLLGGPVLAAIALDGYAADVAFKAGDLAARAGGRVVLAHVLEEGEDDREVHDLLDKLASQLEPRGVEVEQRVLAGRPAKALVRLAGEVGATLIVAGKSSRVEGPMGSVAEHLVRRSPTHVLICGKRAQGSS